MTIMCLKDLHFRKVAQSEGETNCTGTVWQAGPFVLESSKQGQAVLLSMVGKGKKGTRPWPLILSSPPRATVHMPIQLIDCPWQDSH